MSSVLKFHDLAFQKGYDLRQLSNVTNLKNIADFKMHMREVLAISGESDIEENKACLLCLNQGYGLR